jgi:hypothetical protein
VLRQQLDTLAAAVKEREAKAAAAKSPAPKPPRPPGLDPRLPRKPK